MNHLAHVHLSGSNPEHIVGNISADYLRKREALELPLKLQEGVSLHRHIDHSTDNHPEIKGAWAVLRPNHGKYASVIFDIYCDYLLATRWHQFERQPMQKVTEHAYEAILNQGVHLPEDLHNRFKRMIESDWLRQYGSYEGQAYVFERFGRRLSKPALLDGVIDTLRSNEDVFAKAFRTFYPWMQGSCKKLLAKFPREE